MQVSEGVPQVVEEKHGRVQHMEAGRESDSRLNDEVDEVLPEELTDDPALDDLLADFDTTGAEIFEEPDLALVQSTEDTDELGEFEQGGEVSGKTNDPVRAYLREIGTASLLTRLCRDPRAVAQQQVRDEHRAELFLPLGAGKG